ncbi:hypothetical protein J5N97_023495 [Dioscorea zingiberensis]|uniref:KIB1-4 beta-propeller domain-containing protein n=1 Tax=Dioscorea zingiberensis TaxID=325984 RepID=A0A9D5C564_9LILI|nr:hypothetical protein J5N97_023495 [Dioscorea zingiberensis]
MENCPELRKDVLQELMESLPLRDYIRFGAISPSWPAVAKKKLDHPQNQIQKVPLLVFKEDMDKDTTCFFNVFNKKLYHTEVQELRGRSFYGSSYGWLITVDINVDMYLLNPLSRAQIKLPKLHTTFLKRMHLDLEYARYQLIRKVVLTADPGKTSDYLVIASFGDGFSLGYWRPGDLNWTVKTNKSLPIIDVIWYKESIYIVSSKVNAVESRPGVITGLNYLIGSIYIVDFNLNVEEVVPFRMNRRRGRSFKQYLVDVNGDLFIVTRMLARSITTPFTPKRKITIGFEVFKIEYQSGLQMQIVPCESIGEHVFFLGCNDSIVVSTAEMDEQEGDLIYFTDDGSESTSSYCRFEDMGVYNMKVRRRFYLPDTVDELLEFPPVFVEANPC